MRNQMNVSEGEKRELFLEIHNLKNTYQELDFKEKMHQIGPKDKTLWPKAWLICEETWKKNFENYEYIFWDDEKMNVFISNYYPLFYEYLYKKFPYNIQKYDFARYLILYHYGGIYADLDYFCVKNFSKLIDFKKVSIAGSEIIKEKYQNALMISPPKSHFWLEVIKEIILSANFDQELKPNPELFSSTQAFYIVNTTGPFVIERAIEKRFGKDINLLPREMFTLKSDKSIAFHVSTSFWIDSNSYLKEGPTEKNKNIRKGIIEDWNRRRSGIFENKIPSQYIV